MPSEFKVTLSRAQVSQLTTLYTPRLSECSGDEHSNAVVETSLNLTRVPAEVHFLSTNVTITLKTQFSLVFHLST